MKIRLTAMGAVALLGSALSLAPRGAAADDASPGWGFLWNSTNETQTFQIQAVGGMRKSDPLAPGRYAELHRLPTYGLILADGGSFHIDVRAGDVGHRDGLQLRHYKIERRNGRLAVSTGVPAAFVEGWVRWYASQPDFDARLHSLGASGARVPNALEFVAAPRRDEALRRMIQGMYPGIPETITVKTRRVGKDARATVVFGSASTSPYLSPEVAAAVQAAVSRATRVEPSAVSVQIVRRDVPEKPAVYETIVVLVPSLKPEYVQNGVLNMTAIAIAAADIMRSRVAVESQSVAPDGSFVVASKWVYEALAPESPRIRWRVDIRGTIEAARPGEEAMSATVLVRVEEAPRSGEESDFTLVRETEGVRLRAGLQPTQNKQVVGPDVVPPDELETQIGLTLRTTITQSSN